MINIEKSILATALLALCSALCGSPGAGKDLEIPQDALIAADRAFVEWKAMATRDPASLALDGMEGHLQHAALATPFVFYELTEADVAEYVKSKESDPTAFATFRWHAFPIHSEGVYLGSVLVIERKNPPLGAAVQVGNYGWGGVETLDDPLSVTASDVAAASGRAGAKFIGVVRLMVPGVDRFFVIENRGERFFLPSSNVTQLLLQNFTTETLRLMAITTRGMADEKNSFRR